MKKRKFIFGANALGKLLRKMYEEENREPIAAYVVDEAFCNEKSYDGIPLVAYNQLETNAEFIFALGYSSLRKRKGIFERILADGHTVLNFISQYAHVPKSTDMGVGNVIFPGVQFEHFVSIGNNNLFWSKSLICHEVKIGSHNYFSANCTVGGLTCVEEACFFGNSSSTIDNVHVASETQVLPGSILFESTKECTKYIGQPARAIDQHVETGVAIARK